MSGVQVAVLVSIAVAAAACGPEKTTHLEVRCRSGALWAVISSKTIDSEDRDRAVRVAFESKVPLDDDEPLRAEAIAFWDDCRHKFAKKRVARAVVVSMSPVKPGWEMERDERSFEFRRSAADDSWSVQPTTLEP